MSKIKNISSILFLFFLIFFLQSKSFSQKSRKSSVTNVRESEYFFIEGMRFFMLDDHTKSLFYLKKALEINQQNPAINYQISEVLYKTKELAEALKYANAALKLDDQNKYFYIQAAKINESMHRYNDASEIYLKLMKNIPNSEEINFELAATYIFQQKYSDAIKCYDKIEKFYGYNEEITRQKQHIFLKLNDLKSAIEEGRKLIESFPEEPTYVLNQAELLLSNNKNEEGQKLLEKLVVSFPNEPNARVLLWSLYRTKGEPSKAEEQIMIAFSNPELEITSKIKIILDYINMFPNENAKRMAVKLGEQFINTHPSEANSYTIYGDILRELNNSEKALLYYAKALKLDPSNFNVWVYVVSLNYSHNLIDSALQYADQATELFPNQPEFWYYSGYGHYMKKNYKIAAVNLEQAKDLSLSNHNFTIQIFKILGDLYNNLKQYEQSDNAYDEVLKHEPYDEHVLNNYSYYLSLRREKLNLALELSTKLVEKYPNEPTYMDTHAWVLYQLKNYKEARKFLEKAVAGTTNGTIVEHYGDVLYQLGETDKAFEQWIKAKKIGETSIFIDKKIAEKKLYE